MYKVATSIKSIFKLDNIKGSFFLITLPNTIDYIINNLSTYNLILFIDIKLKLFNLAKKHILDVNSTTYAINYYNNNSSKIKGNLTLSNPKLSLKPNKCI